MNRHLPLYILCMLLLTALFSCVGTAPTKEVRFIDSLIEERMLIVTKIWIRPIILHWKPITNPAFTTRESRGLQ